MGIATDRRRIVETIDVKEKRPTLGTHSRKVACVATLTAAGLSFGLVACGGDSTADTTDTAGASVQTTQETPPGGVGGGMELTAAQEKCLAKQGVEAPGDSGEGSDDGSQPTPPAQGSMPDQEEMSTAFEACGVDLPEPPSGSGDMSQPSGQDPTGGAPVRGSDD